EEKPPAQHAQEIPRVDSVLARHADPKDHLLEGNAAGPEQEWRCERRPGRERRKQYSAPGGPLVNERESRERINRGVKLQAREESRANTAGYGCSERRKNLGADERNRDEQEHPRLRAAPIARRREAKIGNRKPRKEESPRRPRNPELAQCP